MSEDALSVDQNGCLIGLPACKWLIAFVPPIEPQWWHRFVHPVHKHCFALRFERPGVWTLVEPWWSRMMIRTLDNHQARRFLRWAEGGDLLLATEHVPGTSSQIRGWMTCAALIAHQLGRHYQVWTPNQLYRRLLAEDDTVEMDAREVIDSIT